MAPVITAISPVAGVTNGGYRVTITGTNLGNGGDIVSVYIAGVQAAIQGQSMTMVVAVAGAASAAARGDVVVTSSSRGGQRLSTGSPIQPVRAAAALACLFANRILVPLPLAPVNLTCLHTK